MTHHTLKSWPHFFAPAYGGFKTFELRKNDRNFKINDTITLREWSPLTEQYSGKELDGIITYVAKEVGEYLRPGYVAFSFTPSVWR